MHYNAKLWDAREKGEWLISSTMSGHFKPSGTCLNELEEVNITIDELESLRLSYLEKDEAGCCGREDAHPPVHLPQDAPENGAEDSRCTGTWKINSSRRRRLYNARKGRNRANGPGTSRWTESRDRDVDREDSAEEEVQELPDQAEFAFCTGCGHEQTHQPGVPCAQMTCSKCGKPMVRK